MNPLWQPETRTDRNWIQTYSGRQFWPLDPRPEEIFIEDIAHALSNVCRYTGHCLEFYSVAQHSVLVSFMASQLYLKKDPSPGRFRRACVVALCGLLHDASEAYIADVSRPVKHSSTFGPIYKAIEANLECQINRRFRLPACLPIVKEADNILLATEKLDLMREPPKKWSDLPTPAGFRITPVSSREAERQFLERFESLTKQRAEDEA